MAPLATGIPEVDFPRTSRLLTAKEFNAVFERRKSSRGRFFTLHQLPVELPVAPPDSTPSEGQANTAKSSPRLGIVVPKKLLRSAVHRNRVKRIARETFRHLAPSLPDWDLIIRLTSKMDPAHQPLDRRAIAADIAQLLAKLAASSLPPGGST